MNLSYFRGKVIILGAEVYNGYIYFEKGLVRVPTDTEKTLPIEYQTFNFTFKSLSPYKIYKITALDKRALKEKNIKPPSPFKIQLATIEGVFTKKEHDREGYIVMDLCNRIKMNIAHKRYWIQKGNKLERSLIFIAGVAITCIINISIPKLFHTGTLNDGKNNSTQDTIHKTLNKSTNTPVKP